MGGIRTRWEERYHLEYLGVGGRVMRVDLCGTELMVVNWIYLAQDWDR